MVYAVANISSCWLYAISRRRIVEQGSTFGFVFFLFSMRVVGENPQPPALSDSPGYEN